MSSRESKEQGPALLHTRARRRLHTLENAWGYEVLRWQGAIPSLVRIRVIDGHSTWRLYGPGRKSDGGPWFEQEE